MQIWAGPNSEQTAKMAANCIRSLLLTPSPTPADHSIARYLFPRLVSFVTNTNTEDPSGARSIVARTLAQYVATLPQRAGADPAKKLAAGMSVVIAALLSRAAGEGEASYGDTKHDLLSLAGADKDVFRAVVAGLGEAQRELVGEVIRWGEGSQEVKDGGGGGTPAIELKMDFGA